MSVGLGLGWGGVTTHTMWRAVLVCLWGWGWGYVGWCGVELQHRPCDVLSCISVGWGGVEWGWVVGCSYNTDHVTCCPVCLWVWDGVELQHRPCDMLSCMSVELGLWSGGITTQTMWRAVLYVCGEGWGVVWCGGVTTQTMWRAVLWGSGGVELQHIPCDMLSCMSVGWGGGGVGCGRVELQHRPCDVGSRLSGWGCNMDPVMCCLGSLWEWGVCNTDCYLWSYIWVCGLGGMVFATQTLLCVILSV